MATEDTSTHHQPVGSEYQDQSESGQQDSADHPAVRQVPISDHGIDGEGGRGEDDEIVQHEEEIVEQDVTVVFKRRQPADGLEGRRSLELINAIYESVETGREVALRFRPRYCRLGLRP